MTTKKTKIQPKGKFFTELELQAMRPGVKIYEGDDFRGIVRSVSDGGISIPWCYRYFSPITKTQREIGCGAWREGGKLKMKEIRQRRDRYHGQVVNGIDPKLNADTKKLEAARRLDEERLLADQREADRVAATD